MTFPFHQLFEQYLANEKFLAPSTIKDLTNDVERFFNYLNKNNTRYAHFHSISNIDEMDVKKYLGNLQIEKNIKNSTYNKLLTHLNRYFIFLFENNLTDTIPTISLKGLNRKNKSATIDKTDWTNNLQQYLQNDNLSFYARITLLLLAHYYTVSEIIQPEFYQVLKNEKWENFEKQFLKEYQKFHNPYEKLQRSKSIYLKQKINLANPTLSLAGLHKILKKDYNKIGIELKPSVLYQNAVITFIKNNQNLTDNQLCQKLKLSKESLNYYRSKF